MSILHLEPIELKTIISSPLDFVWSCIVNPTQLVRWMPETATIELKVGGEYSFTFGPDNDSFHSNGIILELDELKKISHIWHSPASPGDSKVTYLFNSIESGEKTEVTLIHSGFELGEAWETERDVVHWGWHNFLNKLKIYCETGRAVVPQPIIAYIEIDAKPETVWNVLTSTSEMNKWFGNWHSMDPRPGGEMRAGGPNFYYEDGILGLRRVIFWQAPEKFAFTWELPCGETGVSFGLESLENDKTRLHLRHGGIIPFLMPPDRFVSDMWEIYLSNLKAVCEGRKVGLRLDYSKVPNDTKFSVEVQTSASPEACWLAISTTKGLQGWFSKDAEIDPVPGGKMTYNWGGGDPTTVLEVIPGKLLRHDWQDQNTEVTWEIIPIQNGLGSIVRLTHDKFEKKVLSEYWQGWAGFLCSLQAWLETGNRFVLAEYRGI